MKNQIFLMDTFGIILAITFFVATINAQQQKGASPITSNQQQSLSKKTYAVVIGISDYQDGGIPDLRYADKDAEAFGNFLRSPAGGSLNSDQLQVLTNARATAGRIAEALDALIEKAKKDDQVIIYFSGHGDVEGKKLTQPGFLLCWDAPSRVYMGGGTYSLSFLQEVVSTLSVQNQAKVVVITDACHAGKLAGSQIGGAQLTTANLAKQYANEMKILSCQPNEFSLEGPQWGGGRGVFSYHLVEGLFGFADRNSDGQITLGEIDRYLEDHVTAEVAPQSQVPILLGNKTDRLATVNATILADLKKNKSGNISVFASTENRGFEDDVLAGVDTTTLELYRFFQKALKEKVFLVPNAGEPATACADAYYERLIAEPKLARLHSNMTRNYAAALQDDAQQAMNIWLKADVQQLECMGKTMKLEPIPRYLIRAAELLGESHYMYRSLQARQLLFEGILELKYVNNDVKLSHKCLSLFQQSLEMETQSPLPLYLMSRVYANFLQQYDSAFIYAAKARVLAPNWVLPYANLGYILLTTGGQHTLAEKALWEAQAIDSLHPYVINPWAMWNYFQGNLSAALFLFENYRAAGGPIYPCWLNDYGLLLMELGRDSESERSFKQAIALDSTNASAWGNLGYLNTMTHRYVEAEMALKKSIILDSTAGVGWNNLGLLYNLTRRYPEGEVALKKAIALDSAFANAWSNLGTNYVFTRRYTEAEPVLKKVIALNPLNARDAYLYLGDVYRETHRYAESERSFKQAITLDSTYRHSYHSLGILYNYTRRFAEAEAVFKKGIALDSTDVNLLNNLGFCYLETGHYSEAEVAFKKAISLDSTNAGFHRSLGALYFKTNRPAEARRQFLKTIELNPDAQLARLGIAAILAAEGKTSDLSTKAKATAEAFGYVEQAIGKGTTFELLEKDEDLAPLRAEKEQWDTLMKKHFAKQVYYNLACEQSLKGELNQAFESLGQSLTNGWKDYDWMQQDTDLAKLREQANRWKTLMKKHFPDKMK